MVPPRVRLSWPVQPIVRDVALSRAVVGEPPSVMVTLVSSVLVSATPATLMSALTKARKAGVAAAPVVGPINAVFADCVTNEPVSVPVLVTGELVTLNTDTGSASPTLVTLPAVLGIHCGLAPGPCVDST